MPFILALDQGTTSSRAIVFSHDGAIVSMAQREFAQHFPRPGWVEHDPLEIWDSQLAVAREAIAKAKASPSDIAAIGVTNQRETVVMWDRKSGKPIGRAIVWQDRRTADFCNQLKRDGHSEQIAQKTGLVIDPYFSASKIRWMLDNIPDARRRAEAGELAVGTIDTWLLWNLTAGAGDFTGAGGFTGAADFTGAAHATDVSNASRTMLFNLHTGAWDDDLLDLLKIPRQLLPDVRPSSFAFGQSAPALFGKPIPITGIAGDQQAALFGQTCFTRGLAKNTYGTGCFLLMNVGEQPAVSRHQLLSTVAWKTTDAGGATSATKYALEGSVFIGGAVVQWLRDGLGLIDRASDIESLAKSVPDSGGVYLVPAFVGLGAPHWDSSARGAIVGITRGTTRAHFARAALESIAYQVADVLDVMHADSGIELKELRVDGGASANDLLLQFQADLLRIPVVRPKVVETTALGAAYLAGLSMRYWQDEKDVAANWQIDRRFEPRMSNDEATHRRKRWTAALDRARNWEE